MSSALEQPAPTFQDVWRRFRETDRQFKETGLQARWLAQGATLGIAGLWTRWMRGQDARGQLLFW